MIYLYLYLFLLNTLFYSSIQAKTDTNSCHIPSFLTQAFFNNDVKDTLSCIREKKLLNNSDNKQYEIAKKFVFKALSNNSVSVRDYAIKSLLNPFIIQKLRDDQKDMCANKKIDDKTCNKISNEYIKVVLEEIKNKDNNKNLANEIRNTKNGCNVSLLGVSITAISRSDIQGKNDQLLYLLNQVSENSKGSECKKKMVDLIVGSDFKEFADYRGFKWMMENSTPEQYCEEGFISSYYRHLGKKDFDTALESFYSTVRSDPRCAKNAIKFISQVLTNYSEKKDESQKKQFTKHNTILLNIHDLSGIPITNRIQETTQSVAPIPSATTTISNIKTSSHLEGSSNVSNLKNNNNTIMSLSQQQNFSKKSSDCASDEELVKLEKGPPVQDQGDLGDCYAQATADMVNYYNVKKNRVLEKNGSGKSENMWLSGEGVVFSESKSNILDLFHEKTNSLKKVFNNKIIFNRFDSYDTDIFFEGGAVEEMLKSIQYQKKYCAFSKNSVSKNFFKKDELNYLKRIYKKSLLPKSDQICEKYPLLDKGFLDFVNGFSDKSDKLSFYNLIKKNYFDCDKDMPHIGNIETTTKIGNMYERENIKEILYYKGGMPIGIGYCGSIFDDLSNNKKLTEDPIKRKDPPCGPHASLIIGRRKNENGVCQVLIKNSWGAKWPKDKISNLSQKDYIDGALWVDVEILEKYVRRVNVFTEMKNKSN